MHSSREMGMDMIRQSFTATNELVISNGVIHQKYVSKKNQSEEYWLPLKEATIVNYDMCNVVNGVEENGVWRHGVYISENMVKVCEVTKQSIDSLIDGVLLKFNHCNFVTNDKRCWYENNVSTFNNGRQTGKTESILSAIDRVYRENSIRSVLFVQTQIQKDIILERYKRNKYDKDALFVTITCHSKDVIDFRGLGNDFKLFVIDNYKYDEKSEDLVNYIYNYFISGRNHVHVIGLG